MIPSIIDLFVKFCDPCLMCLSLCFNIFWFLYGISSISRGCLWSKLIVSVSLEYLWYQSTTPNFHDAPISISGRAMLSVRRSTLIRVTSHSYMSLILMCMSCYQVSVDLNHDTRLVDCTGNSSCRDHDVSWNMRHIILSCLFSSLILRSTKCCIVCFYQKLDMTSFCVPSYDYPYEWIDEFAWLLFSITGMIHWPMLQLIMPWTSGSRDPARGAPRF
jgi:hypothetical protein